jgi:hypothetical protein
MPEQDGCAGSDTILLQMGVAGIEQCRYVTAGPGLKRLVMFPQRCFGSHPPRNIHTAIAAIRHLKIAAGNVPESFPAEVESFDFSWDASGLYDATSFRSEAAKKDGKGEGPSIAEEGKFMPPKGAGFSVDRALFKLLGEGEPLFFKNT